MRSSPSVIWHRRPFINRDRESRFIEFGNCEEKFSFYHFDRCFSCCFKVLCSFVLLSSVERIWKRKQEEKASTSDVRHNCAITESTIATRIWNWRRVFLVFSVSFSANRILGVSESCEFAIRRNTASQIHFYRMTQELLRRMKIG